MVNELSISTSLFQKFKFKITEIAESYGYWMSGPIRILLGVTGAIGNILSIIVLIKQKTRKTDTDIILLGN